MGLELGLPTAQQSHSPNLPDAGEGRLRRAGRPPPLHCIFSRGPLKLLTHELGTVRRLSQNLLVC